MELRVAFVSSRAELLRLYWQLSRNRSWKRYLATFIVMSLAIFLLLGPDISVLAALATAMAVSGGCVLVLVLLPLRSFKQERCVVVANEEGLGMSVDGRSGHMRWKDIEAVEIIGWHICVFGIDQRTFFVPLRAFVSNQEAMEFYDILGSQLRQHKTAVPPPDEHLRDTGWTIFN